MTTDTEVLRQIVLSNRLASPEAIEQASAWGAAEHPGKDLAEHLFMQGVLDRAQVSLVRKLAKMNRGSGRLTPRSLARPVSDDTTAPPGEGSDPQRETVLDPTVIEPGGEAVHPTVIDPTVIETPEGPELPATPGEPAAPRRAETAPADPPPLEPASATSGSSSSSASSESVSSASASASPEPGSPEPAPRSDARPRAPGAAARVASDKVPTAGRGAPKKEAGAKVGSGKVGGSAAEKVGAGSSAGRVKGRARPKEVAPTPGTAAPAAGAAAAAERRREQAETGALDPRREDELGAAPTLGQSSGTTRAAPPRPRLEPGDPRTVGRYEILERVARGGMGVVYKARHPELDRVFALKLLTARMKDTAEATARFQREAKLAARLDHPNVVRVYDASTDEETGAPFLVMDFVDGPNLDRVIQDEGLGVRKAAQLARSIALALQHAHERGIVHRDVKPENVIIDRATGEPKLTDFGIVKDLEGTHEEEKKLTRTGYTLGSPCYMSPEQAAGRHSEVGPRSDVYSLSATLYEMLSGDPPFDGEAIHDIMVKVIQDDPVALRVKNPAIPPDLDVICLKGLEKQPARRYASAAELAEELRRFLDDEPILAKPAGFGTKLARFARRNRTAVALLAMLALVAAGGAALYWRAELARRADELALREATLSLAEQRIGDARRASGPLERRRALYDALLALDRVLDRHPADERARERKREVLLTLGDQLIESGEASFAEFVFGLGEGLLDPAVVASRTEAARIGRVEEVAREREGAGELEEALRLLRRGFDELTRAGYSGERLEARIRELEQLLAARKRRDEVARLAAQAEEEGRAGRHAEAWRVALQALELAPEDPALEARAAHHQGKAEDAARLLLIDAEGARAQALGVLGKRVEGTLPEPLRTHVSRGDGFLAQGQALLLKRDYQGAGRELISASQAYGEGRRVATVLHAQADTDAAAARAAEASAERFAPRELGQARDFRARAQGAFERGRLDEAVQLFEQASAAFNLAARTGSGKESVSAALRDARDLRGRAAQDLAQDFRLPSFQRAEEEFQQAEAAYRREDWPAARELYVKASAAFRQVLEQADATRQAFGLKAQAEALRREADATLVEKFSPDELRDADELLRQGAQALGRSDPLAAAEHLRKAIFKLDRLVEAARPQASGLRESEALREQVVAAREQASAANLVWKPAYKAAEQELLEGDRLKSEGHWRLAKRRYDKALRGFLELLR